LCQDTLLTAQEAEPLITPKPLHWRTARAALKAKPMSDAEAARYLGRQDVSPDASKARRTLAKRLANLRLKHAAPRDSSPPVVRGLVGR